MFTKIAFTTAAAALLLSAASATFAAPKNQRTLEAMHSQEFSSNPKPTNSKNQPIPEPLYFRHATGEM
jgi:hypothetical protein